MNKHFSNDSIVDYGKSNVQVYLSRVYGWMCCGLLLTAFVAWFVAKNVMEQKLVLPNGAFMVLLFLQLGVVIGLSTMIQRLSTTAATALFMLYSALTGVTLSTLFLVYTSQSIANVFFTTAATFAAMSLYGYATKRDLTGLGSFLFMGLIGIVIASLVNMFWANAALYNGISYIGVLIFVGLTAYDTQKLKMIGEQSNLSDESSFHKASILGALTLYLDFINLFIMLMRILGDRRN